jgi:hypothetical protein
VRVEIVVPITLTTSSYKITVWLVEPGRGAPVPRTDSKHHELYCIGRFWYHEIRDFLNRKRKVHFIFPVAQLPSCSSPAAAAPPPPPAAYFLTPRFVQQAQAT